MTYRFTDRLQDFEFHDSLWTLLSWAGSEPVFAVSRLNVHRDALEAPTDTDMEIEIARLSFSGFSLQTYEPGRGCWYDENGAAHPDEPKDALTGDAAKAAFMAEMAHESRIYSLHCNGPSGEISGTRVDPFFTFRFTFSHVEIAWDAFKGAAWYQP